uniref:Uncharacterized protein TCIL3000_11_6940 n=1 Tax=Trypanosoma congolense (strain IL3000) TaxID=1068625 RepID=G0V0U7_TRYCI|nr:unnamed protein product [Trypanosoma congolense IL3000]
MREFKRWCADCAGCPSSGCHMTELAVLFPDRHPCAPSAVERSDGWRASRRGVLGEPPTSTDGGSCPVVAVGCGTPTSNESSERLAAFISSRFPSPLTRSRVAGKGLIKKKSECRDDNFIEGEVSHCIKTSEFSANLSPTGSRSTFHGVTRISAEISPPCTKDHSSNIDTENQDNSDVFSAIKGTCVDLHFATPSLRKSDFTYTVDAHQSTMDWLEKEHRKHRWRVLRALQQVKPDPWNQLQLVQRYRDATRHMLVHGGKSILSLEARVHSEGII